MSGEVNDEHYSLCLSSIPRIVAVPLRSLLAEHVVIYSDQQSTERARGNAWTVRQDRFAPLWLRVIL